MLEHIDRTSDEDDDDDDAHVHDELVRSKKSCCLCERPDPPKLYREKSFTAYLYVLCTEGKTCLKCCSGRGSSYKVK